RGALCRVCTRAEASDRGGTWPPRISALRLLRLDARLADDFPPLRYFRPEAGGAVLRRAGDRLVTERRQAFLHVRSRDGLCNLPLQQRDDVLRRSGGHDNSKPRFARNVGITGPRPPPDPRPPPPPRPR